MGILGRAGWSRGGREVPCAKTCFGPKKPPPGLWPGMGREGKPQARESQGGPIMQEISGTPGGLYVAGASRRPLR